MNGCFGFDNLYVLVDYTPDKKVEQKQGLIRKDETTGINPIAATFICLLLPILVANLLIDCHFSPSLTYYLYTWTLF